MHAVSVDCGPPWKLLPQSGIAWVDEGGDSRNFLASHLSHSDACPQSRARHTVNILISSQPGPVVAFNSCLSLALDTLLLSRHPSPFSVFVTLIGMPVPGMREHRWEHPLAGFYMGFEGT